MAGMARWQPGARERLIRAALELFEEQGFAETTVPQIADRAGVTNRTFFRYFGDKREVVFGNEDAMIAGLRATLSDVPADLNAGAFLARALGLVATERFEGGRESLRRVRAIIETDGALRERSLSKWYAVHTMLSDLLRERGLPAPRAELLARAATGAVETAIGVWLDRDDETPLDRLALEALGDLAGDLEAVRRAESAPLDA